MERGKRPKSNREFHSYRHSRRRTQSSPFPLCIHSVSRFSPDSERRQCCVSGRDVVKLAPITGRRHQHCWHCVKVLGAPILGDDLHTGGTDVNVTVRREVQATIRYFYFLDRSTTTFPWSCYLSSVVVESNSPLWNYLPIWNQSSIESPISSHHGTHKESHNPY